LILAFLIEIIFEIFKLNALTDFFISRFMFCNKFIISLLCSPCWEAESSLWLILSCFYFKMVSLSISFFSLIQTLQFYFLIIETWISLFFLNISNILNVFFIFTPIESNFWKSLVLYPLHNYSIFLSSHKILRSFHLFMNILIIWKILWLFSRNSTTTKQSFFVNWHILLNTSLQWIDISTGTLEFIIVTFCLLQVCQIIISTYFCETSFCYYRCSVSILNKLFLLLINIYSIR
jgi:hypothetical protein